MLNSMEDIIKANRDTGQHFFSADLMRQWKTRLSGKVHPVKGGTFFVTSDIWSDGERHWTVRFCYDCGMVRTIGEKTTSYRAHRLAVKAADAARRISGGQE